MLKYFFEFDLEKNKVAKITSAATLGIRYYQSEEGPMVWIGDGYRHYMIIEGEYWNRILSMIHNDELDDTGVKAIIRGLMWDAIPEEVESNFIKAILSGVIREIE